MVLRQTTLPPLSELMAIEEDALLSDPSPDWSGPALKSLYEADDEDADDGLGFRSLLEHPEALSEAWLTTRGSRSARHNRRATRAATARRKRAWL